MRKPIFILLTFLLPVFVMTGCEKDNENLTTDKGVLINDITWATRNVGAKGQFVNNPEDEGLLYTFNEAQTVCPTGWRPPTKDEFVLIGATYETATLNGKTGGRFGSGNETIFLPVTGYRSRWDGLVHETFRNEGQYWSSTAPAINLGYYMIFRNGSLWPSEASDNDADGRAVRCVRK
jgi:uncharacterized protein (TIGR02145 family)